MPGTRIANAVSTDIVARHQSSEPRYRRLGMRLSCLPCEVAWTGTVESSCWVCDGPGIAGPPPSIYPDVD